MDPTNEPQQTNNYSIIYDNNNNEDNTNVNNMNEETSTNQVANISKDIKVSEYLNGINNFIKKMKTTQQSGGGNSTIATERAKVAKLFNVLSIEELQSQLQNASSTVVPQPNERQE